MKKILIIEDDSSISELERDYLEASDFDVTIEGNGAIGLEKALNEAFDLLVLDVMLPGKDGFQICREIRQAKEIPILMVSARHEDIDKIRALGLGADDYIIKPFSPSELVARVKAHLARYERLTNTAPATKIKSIQAGELEIQPETHRVFRSGKELILTNKEFELLLFFAENPGIVFSKDRLFDQLWGLDAMGDTATVMVHINRLREKIEPVPSEPKYIETVWGAGYRFSGK
ncbi:MAG: response regulator transcription factor [Anaerovibrio sp.]|uniref:response regulator transcription factor n=1 Tax=Anaerovibrio sp. TaxID=1872532 RepID=UPI0025EAA7BD|nr:response regulator transcription factor [Anaerovibrio sp.]MCR5175620.1 response regulator transcription factor [Anaerovibrio sp.]